MNHQSQPIGTQIPELEPYCGSWIITRRSTGEVICECFDRHIVEKFNPDTCLIETAAQYLGRFNKSINRLTVNPFRLHP